MGVSIDVKAVAAEFFATTLFVWVGTGAAISALYLELGNIGGGALVAISLAFGLCIASLAFAIGHLSGGHINPAVTFAFIILKELDLYSGIAYIFAQLNGAVCGSLLVWGCFSSLVSDCPGNKDNIVDLLFDGTDFSPICASGSKVPFNLGSNGLNDNISILGAFLLELMGTLLLVFTVLHSAIHPKSSAGNAAPIAIGWAVFLAHIVLIPFTGCGINPARSLGPMLVNLFAGNNVWGRGVWVYYVAPFVGSSIACGIFKFFL